VNIRGPDEVRFDSIPVRGIFGSRIVHDIRGLAKPHFATV
jgi:hypothetical protein